MALRYREFENGITRSGLTPCAKGCDVFLGARIKTCKKCKSLFDGIRCKKCAKEYMRSYNKLYRAKNIDRIKENDKNWQKLNPEKVNSRSKNWRLSHPDRHNAKEARRRASKILRVPSWLTKSDWIEINWAYKMAQDKSKESGLLYEVDHIIPLRGENISGLHCPQNLQIITKSENCSKSNKF